MKRCAQAANMSNVVIVLEPEAASLCVQGQNGAQVEAGDVVLVLDCGGGTVDLVTHQVQANGTVKELVAGSGECCGASYVDTNFVELMQLKYQDVFTDWAVNKPKDVLRLRRNWLAAKINFGSTRARRVLMDIPPSLQSALEAANLMDADDDGDLEPSEVEMKSVFDPLVDRILVLAAAQFEASDPSPTKLLLVGGFAASPYLQQRVREAFEERVEVIVPPTPGAAVVKGAVIYGLQPHAIQGRVMRRTFGVEVARTFKASRHNPKHRYHCPDLDKVLALEVFLPLVRAGTMVESGFVASTSIRATSATSQSMTLLFYSCLQRNPVHLDEPGVRLEGAVTVAMPGEGVDRSITVELKLGRTQIQATGINESGHRVETTLQFVQPESNSRHASDRDASRLGNSQRDQCLDYELKQSKRSGILNRSSGRDSHKRRPSAHFEDETVDLSLAVSSNPETLGRAQHAAQVAAAMLGHSPRRSGPTPPPKPDSTDRNFPMLRAGPTESSTPPRPPPQSAKPPASPPPSRAPKRNGLATKSARPPPARKPKPPAPAVKPPAPAALSASSIPPPPPPPPPVGAPAPPPLPSAAGTPPPAPVAAAVALRRPPPTNSGAAPGSGDLLAQIRQGRQLRQSTAFDHPPEADAADEGLMGVLKLKMLMRRSVIVDEDEDSDDWDC